MTTATKLIQADDSRITALLAEWHEAGRGERPRFGDTLNYDRFERKHAKERRKYICLDEGTSGAFVLDRATGQIYRIKAYGVPHKRKLVGRLGEVTGARLLSLRWW